MKFGVDDSRAFEIPLSTVEQASHDKNDVIIDFHQDTSTSVEGVNMDPNFNKFFSFLFYFYSKNWLIDKKFIKIVNNQKLNLRKLKNLFK